MSLSISQAEKRAAEALTETLRIAVTEGTKADNAEVTAACAAAGDYAKIGTNPDDDPKVSQGFRDGPKSHFLAITAAVRREFFNPLPLSSGWASVSGRTPAFQIDAFGVVSLRGAATGGAANSKIGQLPTECRPSFERIFAVANATGVCQVRVTASGEVFSAGNAAGFVGLDGVTFKV